MAAINYWLQTKDYDQGLVLLARYSKNRALIQNLSRKPNPAKLEYELKKLARMNVKPVGKPNPVVPPSGQTKPYTEPKIVPNPDPSKLFIIRDGKEFSVDDLPSDLKALWQANRDSYKEVRSLHEKLKLLQNATPEDRKPLVDRIIELDDLIRENWSVIDAWDPNKETEPEKSENSENVPLDHKRINANRKYISSGLKKIQGGKLDEKRLATIQTQIKSRYVELKAAGVEMTEDTITELKNAGIDL